MMFAPYTTLAAGIPIDPSLRPENLPTASGLNTSTKDQAAAEYQELELRRLLIERVTNVILGIAGIVAVYSIVNNAWWMVASGGKEEAITQHKKGLLWVIMGLIFLILSVSIIRFIISIPFQADEPEKPSSEQRAVERAGTSF